MGSDVAVVDPATFDADDYLLRYADLLGDPNPEHRRAARVELTRDDPLLFALVYLPHHLRGEDTGGRITMSRFHLDLCEQARGWAAPSGLKQHRDAWVAPRESGKSTWLFLCLPLWAAAHGHRRFVLALADAASQAEQHLANLTLELDTNELLQTDYPDLCAVASRERVERAISDNRGLTMRRDGTVFAARGLDSKMLGMKVRNRRPDLIILDDVEPQGARYSPTLVPKRLAAIRETILPLNQRARVVLSGTVTIAGSIVHQLVQTVTTSEEPEAWIAAEGFRVHYYDVLDVDPVTGEQRSLWPEKWPLDWVLAQLGDPAFELNMRNRPVAGVGTFWEPDDIAYAHPTLGCPQCREDTVAGPLFTGKQPLDHDPEFGNTVLSIDPAVTRGATSDYTGLAVLSRAPDNDRRWVFVRHAERRRISSKLRERVVQLLSEYPDIGLVYVETNQGGDVWAELLDDLPVPVREKHQTEPKPVRAARAHRLYRRGPRVFHTRPLPAVEDEMLNYPNGLHDDTLDAVASGVLYFLEGVTKPRRSAGRRQTSYAR